MINKKTYRYPDYKEALRKLKTVHFIREVPTRYNHPGLSSPLFSGSLSI